LIRSSLRRYLTKFKLILASLIISAVLTATVAANIILSKSKKRITQASDKYFTQELSVGSILFLPPQFIILKNVSFLEKTPQGKSELFFIPTIKANLSLRELLIKRHLFITDICFSKPRMDYYQFLGFLRNNFKQIVAFIQDLPLQDIKFFTKGAVLDLANKDNSRSFFTADFALMIKGYSVRGSGSVSRDMEEFLSAGGKKAIRLTRGSPFKYSFKGQLKMDGLLLEDLEFISGNLYSKLWGSSKANVFRLKGFTFVNTLFKDTYSQEPGFNITERVKFLLRRFWVAPILELPEANLYILDIDSQIKFSFPRIQIDRLIFSLNNIPFSVKGNISLAEPVSLDLMFSSYLANLKDAQRENIKKIDLGITGTLKDMAFGGDGRLDIDFVKKVKDSPPLEKLEVAFKGLNSSYAEYPRPDIKIKEASIFCKTDSNEYRIFLKDFNGLLNLENERFKFIEYNCSFYDGSLKGRGGIDMAQSPPGISSTIRVRDVSADNLSGILIHFSKVFGRLNSQMYFRNYPKLELKGGMSIENGYLKDFEFFKWLAQLFNLSSLKTINFSRASSNFLVNTEGAGLHDIDLESKNLSLNGYFTLGKNDLVSSKLSLALTRDLLKESPKFTALLKLLSKDLNRLSFNFQLSGNLGGMNFQWLKSDLKRELEESIPGFIQRKLEKDVEDAIASISAE